MIIGFNLPNTVKLVFQITKEKCCYNGIYTSYFCARLLSWGWNPFYSSLSSLFFNMMILLCCVLFIARSMEGRKLFVWVFFLALHMSCALPKLLESKIFVYRVCGDQWYGGQLCKAWMRSEGNHEKKETSLFTRAESGVLTGFHVGHVPEQAIS